MISNDFISHYHFFLRELKILISCLIDYIKYLFNQIKLGLDYYGLVSMDTNII